MIDASPNPTIWRAIARNDYTELNNSLPDVYILSGWIAEWKKAKTARANLTNAGGDDGGNDDGGDNDDPNNKPPGDSPDRKQPGDADQADRPSKAPRRV